MSERKSSSDAALTALAVGGTILTLGGFVAAISLSGRVSAPQRKREEPDALQASNQDGTSGLPGVDAEDLEAAARMIASENGSGSKVLWAELIGSQLHARRPGQTLYQRITAGSGFGPQGDRAASGGIRPVSTDQPAQPQHRAFATEVLAGRHPARFADAVAFFEPAQVDKAHQIALRAREKLKQGLALTPQEQRLRLYRKTADEVRADWGKTLRLVGIIDGVEFYAMSRIHPEKSDFVARQNAHLLGWPIAPSELQRVGESVMDVRAKSGAPHKGVDLFAPAGTEVRAARSGRVLRVIDGRSAPNQKAKRAGLWVDIEVGKQIDRYMHLGDTRVAEGQKVRRGDVIGVVAEAHTSGTGVAPHLHFEVRSGDYSRERKDYGDPITPQFEVV